MRRVLFRPVALLALVAGVAAVSPADAGPEELPDYVVVSITVDPPTVPRNYYAYATVEVRNDGGVCYGCSSVAIDFYKHRTTPPVRLVSGDFLCFAFPPAPGATATCTASVTYSTWGTYSMWAQVDTYNNATESNESNNILGPQPIVVAEPPELQVLSIQVTPASPLEDQPADVAVTIRNVGWACGDCGLARVDFYKALNNPPGPLQAGDFTCLLDIPDPGSTAVCRGSVTFTHATTFQMWAQVNRLEEVFEMGAWDNGFGPQLITVRPDTDADAIGDSADNCPLWANPSQALPPWSIPAGDSDCDGYSDERETYLGTDPAVHCAADTTNNNETPDSWPPDLNDNRTANTLDAGQFVFSLNSRADQSPPDPRWNQRHDFTANGIVNTLDVGAYVFVLNKTCSPSGP